MGDAMTRPSQERLAEIRAWAAGSFPDGSPHIPAKAPSFTRDLLAELDAVTAERDEAHGELFVEMVFKGQPKETGS